MIKAKQRGAFSIRVLPVTHSNILKPLERLTVAVDLGTETFDQAGISSHRTNTVILWLADDVDNEAITAVRSWAAAGNEPFTLMVKILDGEAIRDMFIFNGVVISAIQHSIFSKESQDERLEAKQFSGFLKPPVARETSAKLLQLAFCEMQHHIITNIQ